MALKLVNQFGAGVKLSPAEWREKIVLPVLSNEAPAKLQNFINGAFADAADGSTVDDISPATGAVIATIPRSKEADVEAAVAAAKTAFETWRNSAPAARADLLDRIADGIEAWSAELAIMESADSGKTIKMASTVDIPRSVANFRFFAGQLRHDETGAWAMHDAINYSVRCPIGPCALICPWNLPLYQLSWKVAPAIACGNSVVAKQSELTPATATALAQIMHVAGCPPGVFNLVHGLGGEVGQALVAHPDVPLVSFTGGTVTGRRVAATCAPLLKRVSLELGGKNATVIFDDAPLDTVVPGAVRAAFTNNGQVCLCGSRIFVQRKIYDAFLPRFVAAVAALRLGDPSLDTTDVGPVSCAMHRDKVVSYIQLGVEEGGTIECGSGAAAAGAGAALGGAGAGAAGAADADAAAGGLREPGAPPAGLPAHLAGGFFVPPTVISGLAPSSRTATEEIFGPVCTVHPFDSEDEVVGAVNAVKYGLAGSIWTADLARAHRVARRIESGILWVNCWLHRDLRTPFGGMKESGIGREGGKFSLEFYSEMKNICVHMGAP